MIKNKFIAVGLAMCLVLGAASGCQTSETSGKTSSNETTSSKATDVTSATSTTSTTSTTSETQSNSGTENGDNMISRSLLSVGNNHRLKAAIAKAQNGEKVTLAYLGGSITEGLNATDRTTDCYAALSAKMFGEKYAKDAANINYVNAGISGTPSTLGLLRSQNDIINHKPDVVFIEFAVNDGQDTSSKVFYESLVKRLLLSESKPAVVLIFTVLENGYSAQDHMSKIGNHYGLGMISVKNAITPEIEAKKFVFLEDYASDEAHPNDKGHQLICDFIENYFDKANAKDTEEEFTMPETPVFGDDYINLVNIPRESELLDLGDFEILERKTYTYSNSWVRKANEASNKPLTFTTEFSKLVVSYRQEKSSSYGKVGVYVDGNLEATLDGSNSNAWGNPVVLSVFSDKESKERKVEFKVIEGSEKKAFILLDIGIVK